MSELKRLHNAMIQDGAINEAMAAKLAFIFKDSPVDETSDSYALLKDRISANLGDINPQTLPQSVQNYLSYIVKRAGPPPQADLVCEIKQTDPSDITFQDVVGQEELKQEMLVNFIYPIQYSGLFQDESKGVLMYGAPGTGKTFIVKAATNVIRHAKFFAPTTGQLLGKYLGDVEKKIDALFRCAAMEVKRAGVGSAIIFMDEFDTIAGLKSDDKSMARSVNALLQAMDGATSHKSVAVVAATNYPWNIEPAILRRFSNQVFVDLAEGPAMLQMMEMSIAKNYGLPHWPQKGRYEQMMKLNQDFKDSEGVYRFINKYGVGLCKGRKLVSRSFLKSLIDPDEAHPKRPYLGMNNRAKIIKREILSPNSSPSRKMMSDFPNNDLPNFGYSSSDIAKIMQIAIKNAANRCVHGKFAMKDIDGRKCFISDVNGTFTLSGDSNRVTQPRETYNFALCEEDVEFAISSYNSTIKPQDYMDLLRYKKWRLAPSEDYNSA